MSLGQLARFVRVAGLRATIARLVGMVRRRRSASGALSLPVAIADLLVEPLADRPPTIRDGIARARPLRVSWVVPAIWPGMGGHHDVFRITRYLESRGHRCELLLYDPVGTQSVAEFRHIAASHFTPVEAPVRRFEEAPVDSHALIATSWATAYPVAAAPGTAERLYFVQDWEPAFHPAGTDHVLAENTYRLGLRGITLGPWLRGLLQERYAMSCDAIDFQVDLDTYRLLGQGGRSGVLFYARPSSPRRAFELGMLALGLFADAHSDEPIHLFGGDLSGVRVPFAHTAHGVLGHGELNHLYNGARAALVLSLTNLSLLPMELLASGCVPVVNDGDNNKFNLPNPNVLYVPPTPRALADALAAAVDRSRTGGPALETTLAESVSGSSWDIAGRQFEAALLRAIP
jgi:hypothetical protein